MQLRTAVPIALGLLLLTTACGDDGDNVIVVGIFTDSYPGAGLTSVDDGSDGSLEASDDRAFTSGDPAPGVVSEATSPVTGNAARMELTTDADTVQWSCRHELGSSAGTTECSGNAGAAFELGPGTNSVRLTLALVATPATLPTGVTQSVSAGIDVDCGNGPTPFVIDLTGARTQDLSIPTTDTAAICPVTLDLSPSSVSSTGAEPVTVIHSVSITARDFAPPECASPVECPLSKPSCGPQGLCQAGREGEPAVVASVHCDTPYVNGFGECSDGDAGSFARGDFECRPHYTFNGSECIGEACVSGADCTNPARPICTPRGCSATGMPGDGASQGLACESGFAPGNVCTDELEQGEDCSQLNTVCAPEYRCFADSTCQEPLPLGSSCAANQECSGAPADNSCNAGICQPKSNLGEVCDPGDDDDCDGVLGCDDGTDTCS